MLPTNNSHRFSPSIAPTLFASPSSTSIITNYLLSNPSPIHPYHYAARTHAVQLSSFHPTVAEPPPPPVPSYALHAWVPRPPPPTSMVTRSMVTRSMVRALRAAAVMDDIAFRGSGMDTCIVNIFPKTVSIAQPNIFALISLSLSFSFLSLVSIFLEPTLRLSTHRMTTRATTRFTSF